MLMRRSRAASGAGATTSPPIARKGPEHVREGPLRKADRQGAGRRPRRAPSPSGRAHDHRDHLVRVRHRREQGPDATSSTPRSARSGRFIFVAGPGPLPPARAGGRSGARPPPGPGHRRRSARASAPARLGAILTGAMVVLVARDRRRSTSTASSTATGSSSPASRSASSASTACTRRAARSRATAASGPTARCSRSTASSGSIGALVLWRSASNNAGAYGMCMALAPFVAVAGVAAQAAASSSSPARRRRTRELSNALGWLLAGSVLMQLLGYSSLLGVNVLKGPSDAKARRARSPPRSSSPGSRRCCSRRCRERCCPKLAEPRRRRSPRRLPHRAQAADGDRRRDRGASAPLAAFTIGVPVGKILFPPFNIDSLDLGLLAAGSGMFIIALTVAQALLALEGSQAGRAGLVPRRPRVRRRDRRRGTPIAELEMRVELGFLAGAAVSTAGHGREPAQPDAARRAGGRHRGRSSPRSSTSRSRSESALLGRADSDAEQRLAEPRRAAGFELADDGHGHPVVEPSPTTAGSGPGRAGGRRATRRRAPTVLT